MEEKTIKLAIVDDHAMFRRGIATILNSFPGISVLGEFEHGGDFLDALKNGAVQPDLCILDIEMRGMSGYETMQELVNNWPEIRALVVSAHDSEFAVLKMITLGAHGYLSKNTTPEELMKSIRFIHEHGYYHSELVGSKLLNQEKLTIVRSISSGDLQHISYLSTEYSIKELSELLNKSTRTLEKRTEAIYHRLELSSRTGLAVFAAQAGIKPWSPDSN